MNSEREKYERVWSSVGRYGKDWMNPGLGGTYKRNMLATLPAKTSVMDFGCGNGSLIEWLRSQGHSAYGVDIAGNATKQTGVTFADLRDAPELECTDYGICTDVMEHIPTDDVDKVISTIAKTVSVGVMFGIARDEDKDGAEVGLVLHLTRKPKEFWDEHILKHFRGVEPFIYNDNSYCFWAFK